MREATWLARWEIRRTWPSFPCTTLIWVIMGVFASMILLDVFDGGHEEFPAAGIFLLAACQALATNAGSRDSWVSGNTAYPDRVAFFRSLPISATQVVASRVLSRLPVLLLNSAALFVPPYLVSVAVGSGVAQELGLLPYLWFALMWVGYALVMGSWILYGELAMHGRAYMKAQYVGAIPFLAAVLVLVFAFRVHVVAGTAHFAQTYGPLSAGVALLCGAGASALWMAATSRRLARRDLLA